MRRRAFVAGTAFAALLPLGVGAQAPRKIARIGMLWHAGSAEEERPYLEAVHRGLRDFGYVEGANLIADYRYPNEEPERFRSMAAELVALKPDVLLAGGAAAAVAAKNATSTIPVVFMAVPDPIASKLVDNLARPGGNVTGLSNFAVQLSAKRLALLKEGIPNLSRVALLINPNVAITRRYVEESEVAAAELKVSIELVEARRLDDLEKAFDAMVRARVEAVAINAEGLFFQGRQIVPKLALERRLPTCVYSRETLEPGALMSYGPDQPALFRRAAAYVDKLLKGARPSDLPVEQPAKFEFLINPEDRKGTRSYRSVNAASDGRRGDRVARQKPLRSFDSRFSLQVGPTRPGAGRSAGSAREKCLRSAVQQGRAAWRRAWG